MNAFIRLIYAILIGLSVVAFVGVGIFSFYQPPKEPAYPDYSYDGSEDEYQRQEKAYEQSRNKYEKATDTYYRNVSYIGLASAVVIIAAGLYLLRKGAEVTGEGLALGGVATAIYGIITASVADARMVRFLGVTLLLLSILLIANFRFATKGSRKIS